MALEKFCDPGGIGMECLAALLAEVRASQEAMEAGQKELKRDMETSQKEIRTVLALQRSQQQVKEELKAEVKSSHLDIRNVLEEIQRVREEMEARLNTQADLVLLIKEVSTNLTCVDKAFQKMEERQKVLTSLHLPTREDIEHGFFFENCLHKMHVNFQKPVEANGLDEEHGNMVVRGKTMVIIAQGFGLVMWFLLAICNACKKYHFFS